MKKKIIRINWDGEGEDRKKKMERIGKTFFVCHQYLI